MGLSHSSSEKMTFLLIFVTNTSALTQRIFYQVLSEQQISQLFQLSHTESQLFNPDIPNIGMTITAKSGH